MARLPFAAVALTLAALAALAALAGEPSPDLERLRSWMTGSFSSAAQSAADPDFRDIRLHMAPIWPERTDGVWLYVEQAVAATPDQPYRQRVYRLRQLDAGHFESQVFELADPARAVGAWRLPRPLAELGPDHLEERVGCAIQLRWAGDAFVGSTRDRQCASELRGATWASSEVTLTADRLLSWDRGFDAAGEQVWGAVTGGYVFDRVAEPPPPEPAPAPTPGAP